MSPKEGKERPIVVGIGEVLWDLLPGGRALGGAPINVACHAAQLGAAATAVSAVGDDAFGREIIERLHGFGLDTAHMGVVQKFPTGTVGVTLDAHGVPTFTIHQPVAWDEIRMTDNVRALARTADAVAFGSLAQRSPTSRQSIGEFLDATPKDCIRVFDINLRQQFYTAEIITASLRRATVLKVNDTELPVIADLLGLHGEETDLLKALVMAYKLQLVILTKGAQGSRMMSADEDVAHPGCKAKVVDSVGAGDSFTATATMGLLRGLSLSRIQDAANRVAAYVCSQSGAVPVLPKELQLTTECTETEKQR